MECHQRICVRTYCKRRELCALLRSSLGGRRVWGRGETRKAESLHSSPGATATLLISYTLIQKKIEKQNNEKEWQSCYDYTSPYGGVYDTPIIINATTCSNWHDFEFVILFYRFFCSSRAIVLPATRCCSLCLCICNIS